MGARNRVEASRGAVACGRRHRQPPSDPIVPSPVGRQPRGYRGGMAPPHEARQVAESFGEDAERYDRTRPRYPAALIERIAAAGRDVLDVGSGTGIAARQLQAAGCRVLGVEPDAAHGRVRAAPRRRRPRWRRSRSGSPAGRTFDAVVAGQAWHWVDPVAGAAKAAQVLRPGGLLVVFWNAFALPPALADAFSAVYERVLPGSPISLTRPRRLPHVGRHGRRRHARRVRRARGVAVRLGAHLHPRRVARRRCRRSAATATLSADQRARAAGGDRGGDRRGRRPVRHALHDVGGGGRPQLPA